MPDLSPLEPDRRYPGMRRFGVWALIIAGFWHQHAGDAHGWVAVPFAVVVVAGLVCAVWTLAEWSCPDAATYVSPGVPRTSGEDTNGH
jgi:hypothetical protein